MIRMAIDPGKSGAICWEVDGETTSHKCPETFFEMVHLLRDLKRLARKHNMKIRAITEKVHSMPKQGVSSVWSFSGNHHIWMGGMLALKIPFKEIAPKKWQKSVGNMPADKKKRKNMIKEYSARCYPDIKVILANADALAMLSVIDKVW